jgi:c-di-GMP-binding flagellar brake protein YcgR
MAVIIDISVNGMYVELPLEPEAQLGDVVALSSDDNFAVARVVHMTRDEEQAKQFVGVEIAEMSPEFASDLNAVVASLRGDSGQLNELWDRR